jgi:hypothetical protein
MPSVELRASQGGGDMVSYRVGERMMAKKYYAFPAA